MAFWDDAKKKVLQAMKPRQQEEQLLSNRADGGFSGYVPKMTRTQAEPNPTGYQQQAPAGFENMIPMGVDASAMQGFRPVGGQTGAMPPAGQQFQQGMPAQPQQSAFGRTAYQPPVQNRQPQQAFQPNPPQATRPGFGQPAFQQPQPQPVQPQQPPRGFTTQQPPVQPQQDNQTFAFPGGDSFMVDGNAYKLVFRVAQITGVPSCFRVIEFMYNNEAVIVNAEQVTDLVEADRCMDLIFGAACAMKQRLMRVSGKQIYLITPPQVYVAPFEPLRRAGMADIERRWPGAMQSGAQMMQQAPVNNVQPMTFDRPQARQEDFAGGFGRRAARNAVHTNGYTDYGGFGVKSR